MSVRVLLADDHKVVREGLRCLLDKQPGLEVLGECTTGSETVAQTRALGPDVVVIDSSIRSMPAAAAIQGILAASPDTRTLVLSRTRDRRVLNAMLRAGAAAFLLKSCSLRELVTAIRAVSSRGGPYVDKTMQSDLFDACRNAVHVEMNTTLSRLSRRERQVLSLVVDGMNVRQIARTLTLSPKTVEVHRRRLMRKLSVDSVAGLTRLALREGLTDLDA